MAAVNFTKNLTSFLLWVWLYLVGVSLPFLCNPNNSCALIWTSIYILQKTFHARTKLFKFSDAVFSSIYFIYIILYYFSFFLNFIYIKFLVRTWLFVLLKTDIWDKVFKNGPSKICGWQPFKILKGYGLFKQTISHKFFKVCLPQVLLGPFLNTLFHLFWISILFDVFITACKSQ